MNGCAGAPGRYQRPKTASLDRVTYHDLGSKRWAYPESNGRQYRGAVGGWYPLLFTYAQRLFGALGAIEIVWSAIEWILAQDDAPTVLSQQRRRVITIRFSYVLLLNAKVWIPLLMESSMTGGSAVSGMPRLEIEPQPLSSQGLGLANQRLASLSVSGLFAAPVPTLAGVFAPLITLTAFALVAAQLVWALVESHIMIGMGVFLLAFASSCWTTFFSERSLSLVAGIGLKL